MLLKAIADDGEDPDDSEDRKFPVGVLSSLFMDDGTAEARRGAADRLHEILGNLWDWRSKEPLGDVPDSCFWRIQRIGTPIVADDERPPCLDGDTKDSDGWARLRRNLRAIFAVSASDAARFLELPNAEWITEINRNVALTGPVWATVTGRERTWYLAHMQAAIDGKSVLEVLPPMPAKDEPQVVQGGALRGLLWQGCTPPWLCDATVQCACTWTTPPPHPLVRGSSGTNSETVRVTPSFGGRIIDTTRFGRG